MNRPFESYFEQPGNKRFKAMVENQTLKQIYELMNQKIHVQQMIDASERMRPALEAVIEIIETQFPCSNTFNPAHNLRHRQILGSMCRYILEPYGYHPVKAVKLKKGQYIQSATVYGRYT